MSQIEKIDVIDALPSYYLPYAKYVNQTRSLPDARDGLKQGARLILYAQHLNKLTYDKKSRKAVATVSAGMEFSVHGDSSILGTAVRLSQPFSMRYPLIKVEGNNGSQIYGSDTYSAARYLDMSSNKLADEMLSLLDKDTIEKWEWNYTQEKQYPTVLPSLFPNFINGCTGIGVGMATSLPSYNLVEVSRSAIKLLYNPNISFEELYCPIDFATGGTVINEDEVKQSLEKGYGKAAIIRAKIEFDSDNNELVVVELPYQTTSSNVVAEIQKCIEECKIIGIDSVFDGSDMSGVRICIKLNKTALPEKIIQSLYKETSLQSHYGINMMMLENGTTPKLYGFKEILSTYLEHMKMVLRKSYQYDLQKYQDRLEILNGYLIALAHIEEVVAFIKKANSKIDARCELIKTFSFTVNQVDSVLELQLQRLVNLEGLKIENEKKELTDKINYLTNILSNENEFKKNVQSEIERIAKEYGDSRRTQNISLKITKEEVIIEEKNLIVYFTNHHNIYINEVTTLMSQKNGGKGIKLKLEPGEIITKTFMSKTGSSLLGFTNIGKVYNINLQALLETNNINALLSLESNEYLITIAQKGQFPNVIFVTKKGFLKKSLMSAYDFFGKGVISIKLTESDLISTILFLNDDKIGLLSKKGFFKIIETSDINTIGRVAQGVIGMKLDDDDELIDAQIMKLNSTRVLSITSEGYASHSSITEYQVNGRTAKGKNIQKGKVVGFVFTEDTKEVAFFTNKKIIRVPLETIPQTTRGDNGNLVIEPQKEKIMGVVKID